jgi:hypothetical protein
MPCGGCRGRFHPQCHAGSVHLDDEFVFAAGEVGDVGFDWQLAHEFVAAESTIAEFGPQAAFGFGVVPAELAGAGAGNVVEVCHVDKTEWAWNSVGEGFSGGDEEPSSPASRVLLPSFGREKGIALTPPSPVP